MEISVKSERGAICALAARSKRARQDFARLRVAAGGKATWRWLAADQAPAGNWTFKASCRRARQHGSAKLRVFVLTGNYDGSTGELVQRSTTTVASGQLAIPKPRVTPIRSGGAADRAHSRATLVVHAASNAYPRGQCTWYAKERRPDARNDWGNAGNWIYAARRAGFPTGGTPAVGAIAVFPPGVQGAGGLGHVAIVERISGGRIYVAESNWIPLTIGHHWSSVRGLSFIYARGQVPGPPAPPPFSATLDAQFPAPPVTVTAGGAEIQVGWNIRFNQAFNGGAFVMRTTTPAAAARFTRVAGDLRGTVAANDDHVGFFRTALSASFNAPPGTYFLQWNVINTATGQVSRLQPSLNLVVKAPPPSTQPPPPPPQGQPPVPTTIGVFASRSGRDDLWDLRFTNTAGPPDIEMQYGPEGSLPVVGDWDGNGTTTVGTFDPNSRTWNLRNSNSAGAPDAGTFQYGPPGNVAVVGDWDGNGTTTVGTFDPNSGTWNLRNSNSGGAPDAGTFQYGGPGAKPVTGRWGRP